MRSRAAARSVAAMRLSLPSLTAAVGATAAVLAAAAPAQGADAIYGGAAKGGAPIVVKADAELTSCSRSSSPGRALQRRPLLRQRRRADAGRARRRASRPARASCWSSATPRASFSGTQLYASDLGDDRRGHPGRR